MDYLLYEPEDFASDESYLRYYFRLNETDVAFWQHWISNHPERLDIITNADQLIDFLALHLDENEFQQEYERIVQAITVTQSQPTALPDKEFPVANTISIRRKKTFRLAMAAALVFFVVLTTLLLINLPGNKKASAGNADTPFLASSNVHKQTNNSNKPLQLQLEDGSRITLTPGSSLSAPDHFLADKREVMLDGEAFFEVSRNVKRPFYVYYNNVVTHVLGTSFNIKTDKQKAQVEVSVRTGKVEVYEKEDAIAKKATGSRGKGVILTPNQKVVYREESKQFESSLVDVPLPIPNHPTGNQESVNIENVISKATPVKDIFKSMEMIYGIEIEVKNENIYNCHFSGDISDLNLYIKLDIICQSLNASYETRGTKILISGKGCN